MKKALVLTFFLVAKNAFSFIPVLPVIGTVLTKAFVSLPFAGKVMLTVAGLHQHNRLIKNYPAVGEGERKLANAAYEGAVMAKDLTVFAAQGAYSKGTGYMNARAAAKKETREKADAIIRDYNEAKKNPGHIDSYSFLPMSTGDYQWVTTSNISRGTPLPIMSAEQVAEQQRETEID